MDPTALLNSYRVSLLSDAIGLRIVAVLYKDGPSSASSLALELGLSQAVLANKLTELFRANLAKQNHEQHWTVTEHAMRVLDVTGISQVVASSLVDEVDTEAEGSFLRAICEARFNTEKGLPGRMVPYLKYANTFAHFSPTPKSGDADKKRLLLWDLIVGLDSSSHELGASEFYSYIIKWHQGRETSLWKHWSHAWLDRKKHYLKKLNSCLGNLSHSNALLFSKKQPASSEESRYIVFFTLLRTLGAISSGDADPGLRACMSADEDLADYVWRDLGREHAWFIKGCSDAFQSNSSSFATRRSIVHSQAPLESLRSVFADWSNTACTSYNRTDERAIVASKETEIVSQTESLACRYAILRHSVQNPRMFDSNFKARVKVWTQQLKDGQTPKRARQKKGVPSKRSGG